MTRNYKLRSGRDKNVVSYLLEILHSKGFTNSELCRRLGKSTTYFSGPRIMKRNGARKSDLAFLSNLAQNIEVPEPLEMNKDMIQRVFKACGLAPSNIASSIDRSREFFHNGPRRPTNVFLSSGELILIEDNFGLTRELILKKAAELQELDHTLDVLPLVEFAKTNTAPKENREDAKQSESSDGVLKHLWIIARELENINSSLGNINNTITAVFGKKK